jgi:hypothetical protein
MKLGGRAPGALLVQLNESATVSVFTVLAEQLLPSHVCILQKGVEGATREKGLMYVAEKLLASMR